MADADPVLWTDPETAVLEDELAALGEELAKAETALAEARGLLKAFTRAHDRVMAPLYAELDEVEARIAEICAAGSGRPDDLRDARAARARAGESARAAETAASLEAVPPPPAEARPLYRALAKRCHPDLGIDEADRERRRAFMIRVNDAYARGDIDLLGLLTREWEAAEDAAAGRDGGPDRLSRLRTAVEAARSRLAQVRAELAEVTGTGLGPLLFGEQAHGMQAALERLDVLAGQLRSTISERRQVLADLMRRCP
jgi:hypothetical protein